MNYEEVKQKYAKQVKERANGVAIARNRVERVEALIAHHTAEREQYRQKGSTIDATAREMWRKHTHEIMQLNAKLDTAQLEQSKAEIGENELNSIDNFIK